MSKKHWIYIKRGLSEDAKHRAAMGECVWLYMHIIDRADWEMGIAYDWKDKEEAADMGMPVDTLRWQRHKLEVGDYIRCNQKQHSQDITIMEWRNPRDYSSEVKNPRIEGSNETLPLEFEGLNQGSNEGSNQVPSGIKTSTYNSKSKDSKSKAATPRPPTPPEILVYREVTRLYPPKVNWDSVVLIIQSVSKRLGREATAEDLRPFFAEWTFRGFKPTNINWTSWAVSGIVPNGKAEQSEPKGFDAARRFLAMHGVTQNG